MSSPGPKIPVHERFPNRYTGGYNSSIVTQKLKYATIVAAKASSQIPVRNSNTDMGVLSAGVAASECCRPS